MTKARIIIFFVLFPWSVVFGAFVLYIRSNFARSIAAQEREMDSGFAIYRDPVPVPKHSRVSGGCSHQRRKLISKQALGVRTTP